MALTDEHVARGLLEKGAVIAWDEGLMTKEEMERALAWLDGLTDRLAAAEERAERLAARLQIAERVCEAVGMYESSTTAVIPYTEPRMRDAYVSWRNYVHDRAALAPPPATKEE